GRLLVADGDDLDLTPPRDGVEDRYVVHADDPEHLVDAEREQRFVDRVAARPRHLPMIAHLRVWPMRRRSRRPKPRPASPARPDTTPSVHQRNAFATAGPAGTNTPSCLVFPNTCSEAGTPVVAMTVQGPSLRRRIFVAL